MFWSLFCNNEKREETKPSALMDGDDELIPGTVTDLSSYSSFPHLENLNQPSQRFADDDVSIAIEDLFEPISEIEQPFEDPNDNVKEIVLLGTPPNVEPQNEDTPEVSKPEVSMEEFIAILQKIEKENAWYEKRQAKKVGGNKKSRRNNKTKKTKNVPGLQRRTNKKARTNSTNIIQAAAPLPLKTRN